jgi:hypothetical protein
MTTELSPTDYFDLAKAIVTAGAVTGALTYLIPKYVRWEIRSEERESRRRFAKSYPAPQSGGRKERLIAPGI